MSEVAVIGEPARVSGFALAGMLVFPADSPQEVRHAWDELTTSVGVVFLTAQAAAALGTRMHAQGAPLSVVMPS